LAFRPVPGFRAVEDEFAGRICGEFKGDFFIHREFFLDSEFIDHEVMHALGIGGMDTDEIAFLNAHLLEREPDAGLIIVSGGGEFFNRVIRS